MVAYKIYRNKFYLTKGNGGIVEMGASRAPLTSPQPLQWSDNIIYDTRPNARILVLKVSDHSHSIIDRNQYYAPQSSAFNYNSGTPLNLRSWQALGTNIDPNSKLANPRWINPSEGNFNT